MDGRCLPRYIPANITIFLAGAAQRRFMRSHSIPGNSLSAGCVYEYYAAVRFCWLPAPRSGNLIPGVLPMRNIPLLPLAVVLCLSASPALAEDITDGQARWPQFRGPGGQGTGSEKL